METEIKSWQYWLLLSVAYIFFLSIALDKGLVGIDIANFSVQAVMLAAILITARKTLKEMSASTSKTVESISKTSEDQIKQLEKTTFELNKISDSLIILEKDVREKQSKTPNLKVLFNANPNNFIKLKNNQKQIIEIILWNSGKVSAKNPCWFIFVPPEIELVNTGEFQSVKQPSGFSYSGYTLLYHDSRSNMPLGKAISEIEIKTKSNVLGERILYVNTSADDLPEKEKDSELIIEFRG